MNISSRHYRTRQFNNGEDTVGEGEGKWGTIGTGEGETIEGVCAEVTMVGDTKEGD